MPHGVPSFFVRKCAKQATGLNGNHTLGRMSRAHCRIELVKLGTLAASMRPDEDDGERMHTGVSTDILCYTVDDALDCRLELTVRFIKFAVIVLHHHIGFRHKESLLLVPLFSQGELFCGYRRPLLYAPLKYIPRVRFNKNHGEVFLRYKLFNCTHPAHLDFANDDVATRNRFQYLGLECTVQIAAILFNPFEKGSFVDARLKLIL